MKIIEENVGFLFDTIEAQGKIIHKGTQVIIKSILDDFGNHCLFISSSFENLLIYTAKLSSEYIEII